MLRTLSIFCLILSITCSVSASKLPIPRFVSIKSQEVNARTGPNLRYPLKWVYVKKGEPVEIVAEFENWRKIKDYKGDESWVHESMISGKRTAIITPGDNLLLYKKPTESSGIVAKLEAGVRANLEKCKENWCQISVNSNKGWAQRSRLFGIYEQEIFK